MRSIAILAGMLSFALVSEPASADPMNNTSENVFVIFNFGGFGGGGDNEEYYYLSSEYSECETSNLFIINLASVNGTIEDFIGLNFGDFSDLPDLEGLEYFVLGHITGSDHLILSSDGEAEPIPDDFEDPLIDGIRNMDELDPLLAEEGGMAFVSPEDFEAQFGVGIETFTEPGEEIPFDTVASVGDDSGVALNGFTDPVFLGNLILDFTDGQLVATIVPEPGLSILAVLGVAGAVIARRRRRAA